MPFPVLGYWDVRGLAQPSRLLLQFLGVEYEDRRYAFGPAPAYDQDSWLADKFRLELRFPNVPYLIDGNVKLTESRAILKYIARTRGPELVPTDAVTLGLVDEIEGVVTDLQTTLINVAYGKETYESVKESVGAKLEFLNAFLKRRKYVAADKLTYIDFHLYELIFQYEKFQEHQNMEILKPFQNINKYARNFESLDELKEVIESSARIKVYSPLATIYF